ncbi:MAG TPA: HEAT repeat domain-containing protein [Aggregatilineales bacterium]|nr:HEAT repeat domain-containing protein [Aggregatilineales bacterium]
MQSSNPLRPDALGTFITSLSTADPMQFAEAVRQVMDHAEEAVPQLLAALPQQAVFLQRRLVKLLADYAEVHPDSRLIAPMLDLVTAEDPIIASGAFRILADSMEQVWPDVVRLLPACDALIKLQIAKALGTVHDPKVVPGLMTLLRHTDYASLRYTLIEVLGQTAEPGDADVIALIETYQNDDDHHVQERTKQALLRLKGQAPQAGGQDK